MAAVPSIGRAARVEGRPAPGAELTRDLYEQYGNQIFRYCLHQLGSREEAEDAVQSTFLNAFRGIKRGVVPELESAWLFKIAHNVCLSRRRTSWRRGRIESPTDFDVVEELTPAPARRSDELIGLQEVLEQMPENQRRAILLREWQGLSYREIAEELELSQAAVETLIFRARRALASGLEQPPEAKRRIVRGADLGNILAGLKSLLLGGSAAAKVAATVAVVSASTVVAAAPVEQYRAQAHVPKRPAPAQAKHHTAPAVAGPSVAGPVTAFPAKGGVHPHARPRLQASAARAFGQAETGSAPAPAPIEAPADQAGSAPVEAPAAAPSPPAASEPAASVPAVPPPATADKATSDKGTTVMPVVQGAGSIAAKVTDHVKNTIAAGTTSAPAGLVPPTSPAVVQPTPPSSLTLQTQTTTTQPTTTDKRPFTPVPGAAPVVVQAPTPPAPPALPGGLSKNDGKTTQTPSVVAPAVAAPVVAVPTVVTPPTAVTPVVSNPALSLNGSTTSVKTRDIWTSQSSG